MLHSYGLCLHCVQSYSLMIYLPNEVLRWSIRRTYDYKNDSAVGGGQVFHSYGSEPRFYGAGEGAAANPPRCRALYVVRWRARARGKVGRFGPGRRLDVDGHNMHPAQPQPQPHIRQGCCPSGWYVRTYGRLRSAQTKKIPCPPACPPAV